MVTKKPKETKKKATKPKAPRNPNIGYKTKGGQGRTTDPTDYQTGTSITEIDQPRFALRPGRRISRNGNVYWEDRTNRSDRNPATGL
jgi:hypothetical protein